jgi:RecJ-like exonuclease
MRSTAAKTRLLEALAIALIAATAFGIAPKHTPIAAVRTLAQGTTVTVMGSVTVPSGAFRSSSEDEGFAIADQTGGIWVSVKKNPNLTVGQIVLITGTLGTRAGKLQIVASSIETLSGSALTVATGQVGRTTLGHLITVVGVVTAAGVASDLPYGYKVFLDDGSGAVQVYLNASTNIDPKAPHLKAGQRLRVTGFASQYETTYEIEPRSKHDLTPLPPSK